VAAWLDRQPSSAVWTTSITVFELRVGLELLPIGKRRAGLFADMERLLASINNRVVPFDTEAADEAGILMATRKAEGRPKELRDTMIAGIVLSRRASLATRNVRDFDDISAAVVNPWTST
jgi:hypothetical protein